MFAENLKTNKKMGRRKIENKKQRITVRLSPATLNLFAILQAENNCSVTSIIEECIDAHMNTLLSKLPKYGKE